MPEIVVITDTSCLIALTKIEALQLLQNLYQEIVVTEEIANEFGEPLPEWIKVQKVSDRKYLKILSGILDLGEASAIALAFDLENVLLVIDDLKGRKEAQKLGFKITGTLGILYKARQNGFVLELKPYLIKLRAAGFRLSESIEAELLRRSNEK